MSDSEENNQDIEIPMVPPKLERSRAYNVIKLQDGVEDMKIPVAKLKEMLVSKAVMNKLKNQTKKPRAPPTEKQLIQRKLFSDMMKEASRKLKEERAQKLQKEMEETIITVKTRPTQKRGPYMTKAKKKAAAAVEYGDTETEAETEPEPEPVKLTRTRAKPRVKTVSVNVNETQVSDDDDDLDTCVSDSTDTAAIKKTIRKKSNIVKKVKKVIEKPDVDNYLPNNIFSKW